MTENASETPENERRSCPECGTDGVDEHPIFDLWMCDGCEVAFNDDGQVVAR